MAGGSGRVGIVSDEQSVGRAMPSVCIVSGANRVRYRSHVNHRVFADVNGCDYRFDFGVNLGGLRSHFDIKLRALQRLLPMYEWLLWVDDDVWFTDFRPETFASLLTEADDRAADIVIAKGAVEPRGFSSYPNSGVILLRRSDSASRLLASVLAVPIDEVSEWWDAERFGIFTNGDQDQIVKALHDLELGPRTWLTDPERLNSRSHLYPNSPEDALARHFCGHYDRELSIAQFAARFSLSPDLVPPALADQFGLGVAGMSDLERQLREARRNLRGRSKPFLKPVRDRVRAGTEAIRSRL